MSGQPVAWRARRVAARCTASTTIGTPAESASASTRSRRSLAPRSRGWASPFSVASRAAASEMSPARRVRVAALSATRLPIWRRSSSMPSPVRAEVARRGTSPRPSASSSRRTSASMPGRACCATSSTWFSTTSITSAWEARGPGTARGSPGRRTSADPAPQTIRSVRPTSRSTSRWSGHLGGVVVGQVEQHQPVESLVLGAIEHRVTGDAVSRRDLEPLEQGRRPGRRPRCQR